MGGEDLKKLMGKLKKDKKKKEEKPVEKEKPAKEEKEVSEEDLVGAEEEQKEDADQKKEEQEKEAQELIEHEVAILQNKGIFNRELLGVLRELIDVHKVNTQTLLDIKELIGGAVDGKK